MNANVYAPPADPWVPVTDGGPAPEAYVSVYLSSPLARLPVRDVTRLEDNKSDPNLETSTYGLFSTCEPIMRTSIANRGIREIFFVTTIEGRGRALVGYYALGWSAIVDEGDVAFAASQSRFVDPIMVASLRGRAGKALQPRLRNFKIVDAPTATALRHAVDEHPDRTDDYLAEITRLERMSLSRTGFRYPSWDRKEPFSWDAAAPYLSDLNVAEDAPNSSPTGAWICAACKSRIVNRARLKVCNVCNARGTLIPEESH